MSYAAKTILTDKAKRALARFEKAVEDRAFIGSQRPEDHALIEAEYKLAKRALKDLLPNTVAYVTDIS